MNREESSLEYWGNKNIQEGYVDMIAIGRQSLADPLLPKKLYESRSDEANWCTACNNCIEFLIRQKNMGCAAYSKEYAKELQKIRKELGRIKEKHTCGVYDLDYALTLLRAGADQLGVSRGEQLVREFIERFGDSVKL